MGGKGRNHKGKLLENPKHEGQDALVRTEVNGKAECVFQEKKLSSLMDWIQETKETQCQRNEYFQLEGGTAEGTCDECGQVDNGGHHVEPGKGFGQTVVAGEVDVGTERQGWLSNRACNSKRPRSAGTDFAKQPTL